MTFFFKRGVSVKAVINIDRTYYSEVPAVLISNIDHTVFKNGDKITGFQYKSKFISDIFLKNDIFFVSAEAWLITNSCEFTENTVIINTVHIIIGSYFGNNIGYRVHFNRLSLCFDSHADIGL